MGIVAAIEELVLSEMLDRRSRIERLDGVTGNKQSSSVILRISHSSTLSTPRMLYSFAFFLDGARSLCWVIGVSRRSEDDERIGDTPEAGVLKGDCCSPCKSRFSARDRYPARLACGRRFSGHWATQSESRKLSGAFGSPLGGLVD